MITCHPRGWKVMWFLMVACMFSGLHARGTNIVHHRYKQLYTDPYVYAYFRPEKIAIIIIWVDDLLLFADSVEMMKEMKKKIYTKWKMTDLGKPSKIIGIEIFQSPKRITISQKKRYSVYSKETGTCQCKYCPNATQPIYQNCSKFK